MFSLAGSPTNSGSPGPMTPRWGQTPGSAGAQPATTGSIGDPLSPQGPQEGRATIYNIPQMMSLGSSSAGSPARSADQAQPYSLAGTAPNSNSTILGAPTAGTPLRSVEGTQPPSYGGTAPNSNATSLGPEAAASTAVNSTANAGLPEPHSPQHEPPRGGFLAHIMPVATLTLVPWFQFVAIMLAFAFQGGHRTLASWLLLVLGLLFAFLALNLDKANKRGPMYMYIAVLGVAALAAGFVFGNGIYGMYTSQWWELKIRTMYANVPPSTSAISREDGGLISFTPETMLDLNRVIGYSERGHIYCVAPILDDTQLSEASFWAVGRDCCDHRWNFNCGDARDLQAKAGLVYRETSTLLAPHYRAQYNTAVRQAASVYGMTIPERPVFLVWARDPIALEDQLWSQGVMWLWVSAGTYLVGSIVVGALLHALSPVATAKGF